MMTDCQVNYFPPMHAVALRAKSDRTVRHYNSIGVRLGRAFSRGTIEAIPEGRRHQKPAVPEGRVCGSSLAGPLDAREG